MTEICSRTPNQRATRATRSSNEKDAIVTTYKRLRADSPLSWQKVPSARVCTASDPVCIVFNGPRANPNGRPLVSTRAFQRCLLTHKGTSPVHWHVRCTGFWALHRRPLRAGIALWHRPFGASAVMPKPGPISCQKNTSFRLIWGGVIDGSGSPFMHLWSHSGVTNPTIRGASFRSQHGSRRTR